MSSFEIHNVRRVIEEKEVLYVLALKNKALGWKEISSTIKKQFKDFPYKNVGEYLNRLVEKGLLKQFGKRGVYILPDRLFKEYLVQMKGSSIKLHKLHKN